MLVIVPGGASLSCWWTLESCLSLQTSIGGSLNSLFDSFLLSLLELHLHPQVLHFFPQGLPGSRYVLTGGDSLEGLTGLVGVTGPSGGPQGGSSLGVSAATFSLVSGDLVVDEILLLTSTFLLRVRLPAEHHRAPQREEKST